MYAGAGGVESEGFVADFFVEFEGAGVAIGVGDGAGSCLEGGGPGSDDLLAELGIVAAGFGFKFYEGHDNVGGVSAADDPKVAGAA